MTYSNYLAEKLDKNIVYEEYIAENISCDYSDYLIEQLDKNISYEEYLGDINNINKKRLERKIARQKRKRNGKLKKILLL